MGGADLGGIKGKLTLDNASFKEGIKGAEDAVESFKDVAQDVAGALGMAFSVEKVVEFGKESVEAFGDAEHSIALLDNAIKAQGFQSEETHKKTKELADALESQTVYSDDAIRASERLLISFAHLSGEGLERTEKAALNLAAVTGHDLPSVTMALVKAHEGHATALQRLGVTMDDAVMKGGDFGAMLSSIEKNTGDAAATELDTYTGKAAQLDHAFQHLKETVGSHLAPEMENLFHYWGIGAQKLSEFIGVADGSSKVIDQNKVDLDALNAMLAFLEGKTNGATEAQFELAASLSHVSLAHLKAGDLTAAETEALVKATQVAKAGEKAYLDTADAAEKKAKAHDRAKVAAEEAAAAEKKLNDELVKSALASLDQADADMKLALAQDRVTESALRSSTDSFFDHLASSADPAAEAVHRAELALREFHAEMDKPGHIMTDDERREAEQLNAALIKARGSMQAFKQEEHATSQETHAMEAAVNQAADALVGMAIDGTSAQQTLKSVERAVATELIKMAIARIFAESAVTGAEVAAHDAPITGPAAVGEGIAASAALSAALLATIPGFKDGGVVDGIDYGYDDKLIKVRGKEEILKPDDPRHVDNLGHAAGGEVHYHYHAHGPSNRTEFERWYRDEVLPVHKKLERNGMT